MQADEDDPRAPQKIRHRRRQAAADHARRRPRRATTSELCHHRQPSSPGRSVDPPRVPIIHVHNPNPNAIDIAGHPTQKSRIPDCRTSIALFPLRTTLRSPLNPQLPNYPTTTRITFHVMLRLDTNPRIYSDRGNLQVWIYSLVPWIYSPLSTVPIPTPVHAHTNTDATPSFFEARVI